MNSVIGALRVVLGLDSAAFSSGLKDAQSRLGKFGPAIKKGLVAAGAAAATAGAAIGVAIKGAINEADDLSKMAAKIGVPIEQLSQLKYAADLSGVSIEGVATGFKKLSTNMVSAAGGNKAAAELFSQLGVAVTNTDGSLRSSTAVLGDIADKLAGMENGAQKTALAVELFGKSGLDLIPLLNGGAAGLKQMTDEANALGLTISQETGTAAEQFNDNISRLQATLSGLVTQIAGSLAPTLASITDFVVQVATGFRNLSPETQKFISVGAALAVGLSAVAVPLGLVVAGIAAIGVPIAAAVAGIAALTAGIIAFWPEIKNAAAAVSEFIAGAWASFVAAWDGVVEKVHVVTAAIKQFGVDLLAIFRALPEQMVQIGGEIIQGLWNGIVAKWETVKAGLYDITSGIKSSFTDFFDIHSPSKVMHEVGRNVMQGFNDGMQSLKGGATEIAGGVGKTVTSSFDSIGSSIADAIKGTKTWKDVALDALKSVASQILSTSNFGGGLGGGIIKGLLGGLIGFANGGSILPGGSGGIDSQVVAFRKSPTEQVDIYDPRKGSRGGGGYAPVYNIDARGADAGAVARIERGLQERDRTEAKRVAGYNHTRSTRGTRA